MLDLQSRQAVADLAESILATRPLIDLLGPRIPVAAECADSLAVANVVADELDVPGFAAADGADDPEDARSQLQRVVCSRLEFDAALVDIRPEAEPDVRAQARRCLADDIEQECEREVVVAPDGAALHTFALGDPDAPPVALSSACGMPARLVEPWLRHVAVDHRVVVQPRHVRIARRRVRRAGRCRRAGVGRHRAAQGPRPRGRTRRRPVRRRGRGRGDGRSHARPRHFAQPLARRLPPRSRHCQDRPPAKPARSDADGGQRTGQRGNIHTALCQSLLGSVPADLAPQVLYPYARPDLFLTYCRLNSAVMEYDLRRDLAEIRQPTLAVTSSADDTAHPQGSTDVADLIDDARLVVNDSGDHISLFRGAATPAGTNGRVRIRPRARPNALTGFNAGPSRAPIASTIRRTQGLSSGRLGR